MSKRTAIYVTLFIVIGLILAACNLPSGSTPTPDPNAAFTAAAQTVEAQLTQAAALSTQPGLATLPPPSVTNTPLPTFTPIPPTPTNTPICDLGQFIKDVNVPDGSDFAPNEAFTKTWRIKNIGECTWSGYSLVFDGGESMSGPASVPIGTVAPGQEVDVSVDLKAPATSNTYRGYWRVRNASGVLIPITGGYQGKSFYVEIDVVLPTTTVNINAAGGDTGGTVYSSGSGIVNGTILAGDTAGNEQARGYMSFNIASLSGKTINSATLKLGACSTMHDPYTDLNGIWIGEILFPTPLAQSAFTIGSTPFTSDAFTSAPGNIDVTSYVQPRVNEGKTYFQVRMHPKIATNNDNEADYFSCGATGPVLTITYQP